MDSDDTEAERRLAKVTRERDAAREALAACAHELWATDNALAHEERVAEILDGWAAHHAEDAGDARATGERALTAGLAACADLRAERDRLREAVERIVPLASSLSARVGASRVLDLATAALGVETDWERIYGAAHVERERDALRAALCALLRAARPAMRRDAGAVARARLVEATVAAEAVLDGTVPRG